MTYMSDFSALNIKKILQNRQPHLRHEVDLVEAAVLLPFVETKDGLSILFEVRSLELGWQPGEICFPGGRVEPGESYEVAAVRETCEELLLSPDSVEVYGPLDYLATQMGVLVYPFVGCIKEFELISYNQAEVAEVFTVPFQQLLQMEPRVAAIQVTTRPVDDDFPYHLLPGYKRGTRLRKKYNLYFYEYEKYVIWGLTAKVLHDFLQTCHES